MARLMTKQESYVERRQLFKNIWEASSQIAEGDEIMSKPKVIRTLRLDEVECTIGKSKKQRIKNLRHVCNKILDFCDKQDTDEDPPSLHHRSTIEPKVVEPEVVPKKGKTIRIRKKIKKTKSLFGPRELAVARVDTSDTVTTSDDALRPSTSEKPSKLGNKSKRSAVKKQVKSKPIPDGVQMCLKITKQGDDSLPRPKTLRKRRLRKKKKNSVTGEIA